MSFRNYCLMPHLGEIVLKKSSSYTSTHTNKHEVTFETWSYSWVRFIFGEPLKTPRRSVIIGGKNKVKDLTGKFSCRKLKTHILVLVQIHIYCTPTICQGLCMALGYKDDYNE